MQSEIYNEISSAMSKESKKYGLAPIVAQWLDVDVLTCISVHSAAYGGDLAC